ncbi:nitrogenase cofactor biosynthesis protein NifB [Propionispora hippei]|uniref:Nitrogen fixation protein NifB n=1 Tax=Propionispora hippei DSM 15287 TaxID=1123003 RepID=A0A1M6CW17_9FIRM|nr:nitrogenase cofactor biosynthesis protein NifB [Propionispora hippei]SHI65186.1 nitrogen fixation protein NifB [Propionispora hippei DSM 15287]
MEQPCPMTGLSGEAVELAAKTAKHPCYSFEAHQKFARMHLPVAPVCNISCNYCNRKYDCVNESRPGVTSAVLTPEEALAKFTRVKAELPQLSVVGIAGPGDALANWRAVRKSIELIKAAAPDTIFCLSTNGLMLPRYAAEIMELGIRHVTVTVNCLEPAIGASIYHHVHYQGNYYVGESAANILINNQLTGIEQLAANGVLVKVNTVMIKAINGSHIPEVVKAVKERGAALSNIMPLIPAPGSVFRHFPQTSRKEVEALRDLCQSELPQMRHCQQCRADAIGLLNEDQSYKFRDAKKELPGNCQSKHGLYKVAVTSRNRRMIDLHYGYAEAFHIYETDGSRSTFLETRNVAKYCSGKATCEESEAVKAVVVQSFADCHAVLTMRIGYEAQKRLQERGIAVIESCAGVEEGLLHAFQVLEAARAPGIA